MYHLIHELTCAILLSRARYNIGSISLCSITVPLLSIKMGSCSKSVTLACTVFGPLNRGLEFHKLVNYRVC